jgi:cobalt/nickel transport system ATP-binding protein
MSEFAHARISHLSFGQKKRACIAGLLAMGHEILLMDEPTAGLDPMGEYRMMRLLMDLNRSKGVTIAMASHSVDLVPLFLDELFILSRGRVTRSGTPEEVFNAPEDMKAVKLRLPHVAELIWKLKEEDGIRFKKLPLTVGEARRVLLERLERG